VRGQRHAPAAFYPRERPGTYCTGGWVDPRASATGRIMSMKKSSDTIVNRTRDLPICSAVPQLLRHRVPQKLS
jgi:hypothetical protein